MQKLNNDIQTRFMSFLYLREAPAFAMVGHIYHLMFCLKDYCLKDIGANV